RGRLANAQVAGVVTVVGEAACVCPGFDLLQDGFFVPGWARGVAERAEVFPEQCRFELLEMFVHAQNSCRIRFVAGAAWRRGRLIPPPSHRLSGCVHHTTLSGATAFSRLRPERTSCARRAG